MQFKLATFTALFAAVNLAAATSARRDAPHDQCNTGEVLCCKSFGSKDSPSISSLLSLVGVAVGSITGQVGATCSPITAIGVGSGSSCSAQPVCCTDNSYNGIVALGCSAVNGNL